MFFNPKRSGGTVQDNLLIKIRELIGSNPGMELPPKIFKEMEGEFMEYVEEQSLTARFPIKESYSNPFGFMQGGMIVAAMDNTLAPLSYLLLPPSITTHVNTTFIRPVKMADEFIHVTAFLVERTPMQIHLRAEVKSPGGKLLATCTSSSAVMRRLKG
jgi:acyl-coenzyme A thioesterase PaaI-like protein